MAGTAEFDAAKATREQRERKAASAGQEEQNSMMPSGIQPCNPILQLSYWPSRVLAMELINAINKNILRNYTSEATIEQVLWVLPTGEDGKRERMLIKAVLAEVYSGWVVMFVNGFGERIILLPRTKIAE
jgi:hypothetical protein